MDAVNGADVNRSAGPRTHSNCTWARCSRAPPTMDVEALSTNAFAIATIAPVQQPYRVAFSAQ